MSRAFAVLRRTRHFAYGVAAGFTAHGLYLVYSLRPDVNFTQSSSGRGSFNEVARAEGLFMSKINLSDFSNQIDLPLPYVMIQRVVVFATVTFCRAFLSYGGKFMVIRDDNYANFLDKILNRESDQGILTVSNHRSLFDDPPILSSLLPYEIAIQPKYLRWNVCAQEYCFSRKDITGIFAAYCGVGQVLPIWRGGGVDQKQFLDFARHIAAGQWCHIFPEAGVYQLDIIGGRELSLKQNRGKGKLKWGVGKMIAHAPKPPVVIPFFHSGMHNVIPYDPVTRKSIDKLPFPRLGRHDVKVLFGQELFFDDLIDAHERKHGKLKRYTPSVVKTVEQNGKLVSVYDSSSDMQRYWISRDCDYELYHKITLRIEAALEGLNNSSKTLA